MATNNETLAKIFLNLGRILAMEGEGKNHFRIVAYQNAARTLQGMTEDVADLVEDGKITGVSGIGASISEKIVEFLETKHIETYDKYLRVYPESFLQVFSIPHIGPKTAQVLFEKFKVRNLTDLEKVLKSGKLQEYERFGEKSVAKILDAIARIKKESHRHPIMSIFPTVYKLVTHLRKYPDTKHIMYAGSIRRFEDTIGDVDLLATTDKPELLIEHFVNYPGTTKVVAKGPTKASIIVDGKLGVDCRVVEPKSYGAALQYFTGSKEHNIRLRNIAKAKDLKLNEYGVFKGDKNIASKTEEDVYKSLGLHWVPPELRRNQGEVAESELHAFPKLVQVTDLKPKKLKKKVDFTEIEFIHWENYPALISDLAVAHKANKIPLFIISDHIPITGTWLIVAREKQPFALDLSKVKKADEWKKEILVGFMRRARITPDLVIVTR